MSKASDIALALTAAVARITQANGFQTDIGVRVFRGKRTIAEDEMPCVVIIEAEDTPEGKGTRTDVKLDQQYLIEGHGACDPDNPNDAAHEFIADLKRAIFSDPTIGGTVKTVSYRGRLIGAREDGVALVFGRIAIGVEYPEDLRNP